jgi:hypothetical protein
MRPVRRGLILVAALAAFAFPGQALAGPCGLSDVRPLWIDYGAADLAPVFGRPGLTLAVSTGAHPQRMRDAGAKTIFWDMNLRQRVGTPTAPADPAVITERAARLFVFAAQQSGCATPWVALNELFGAHLETPWSPSNAQYRANVLQLIRELAARGARPFLLISTEPYTGSDEAVDWWRSVAQVADIVPEVYFNGAALWKQGPVVANRRLRAAYRRAVARLVGIGIPVGRIGLVLGFQSAPGTGGREGLRPREAWFEVIKWQALSARRVAAEMRIPTIFSWGWGTFSAAGRDADKPDAACVWLWSRNPRLCKGLKVAGPRFDPSRSEGQLVLPARAMCKVGRSGTIGMAAIAQLNVLVQDRDVAYSALFARLAEAQAVTVPWRKVLAAERAVIGLRFGRSRAAYLAALGKSRANLAVARGVLADQLRRDKIGRRLRVPRPSLGAVAGFYFSYPELLVRPVRAAPPPAWLGGRRTGLALSEFAPPQLFSVPTGRRATVRTLTGSYAVRAFEPAKPLGSVPLDRARPAIAAALTSFARSDAVVRWSAAAQTGLLKEAVCRRDDLPVTAGIDLLDYLPFLRLSS